MAQKTVYTCDVCNKEITKPYGPMTLTLRMPDYVTLVETAEVCCSACALKWLADSLDQLT